MAHTIWDRAQQIRSEPEFNRLALELFHYQLAHVAVYREFVEAIGHNYSSVHHYSEIPCLPVSFFKTRVVADTAEPSPFYFTSSGTSGQQPSKHHIRDTGIYQESIIKCFRLMYGDPAGYCIMALVPGERERPDSSLGYMIRHLAQATGHPWSGCYMDDHGLLAERLQSFNTKGVQLLVPGITYALLDFFEAHPMRLGDAIILETGGMKGRGKEPVREELHAQLCALTGCTSIHSEYGMCELLSQAYAHADGVFRTPPWMKILLRDPQDPFEPNERIDHGLIRIIDLANVHSCAFLETADLGRRVKPSSFEILGRSDFSEWRGCSLMVV